MKGTRYYLQEGQHIRRRVSQVALCLEYTELSCALIIHSSSVIPTHCPTCQRFRLRHPLYPRLRKQGLNRPRVSNSLSMWRRTRWLTECKESPESPDLEQVVAGLVTKAPSTPSVWPDGLEPTRVSPFGSSIPIDCPKRCPCEANCAAIFM